ncbi:hypothetical protein BJV78DRAFT_1124842 [Lactifluus subvellereus]|nr:hypothetical protein BJV78DRAFT_1124842 [Lactifluus subvellereus]
MVCLSTIPLPLSPNGPPPGYGWEDRDMSVLSTTTAFIAGIDHRDSFLGWRRCIICGIDNARVLRHCHIIRQSEPDVWIRLKERNWIPELAKDNPQHEPRDGLLMCNNHHSFFDGHSFFIRYLPEIRRFVFVNYSGDSHLQQFHGKAIALDIDDHHAPFPSLFIIHEMRVRGYHPFEPTVPIMPDEVPWQDWISSDGVIDSASGSFKRDKRRGNPNNNTSSQQQPQSQPTTMSAGGASSGGRKVELNADVIADILAATHAMPSWKACQMEGTSWAGTAEENIQTYVSSIGVEDR